MSCTSTWEYEKKTGRGWSYNEPTLTYNSAEFDTLDVFYNSLAVETVWDTDSAPVVSPYTYELKTQGGYLYDEPTLEYNSPEFDTFEVYFNSLGMPTNWDTDAAPSSAVYEYEQKNYGALEYNQNGVTYNQPEVDTFINYYNSLGWTTEWFYEDFIDYCKPVVFQFMNGDTYLFMDGAEFEFN